MNLLLISDLHLGNPLFRSEATIMSLLDRDIYNRIIIVGDTIDTWEGTTNRVVKSNKDIIEKINSLSNVVIVSGNHDPSLEEMICIFPNANLIEYKKPYIEDGILVTHGDDFDKLVTHYSFLAKILYPIQWSLEKLGININAMIRNTLHSIACHKEKKYYNDLVLDVEENLVNKYKDDCSYLVAGHTHLPKLVDTNDVTYINCGDWIHNRTYAEYIDGVFSVKKENGDDFFK